MRSIIGNVLQNVFIVFLATPIQQNIFFRQGNPHLYRKSILQNNVIFQKLMPTCWKHSMFEISFRKTPWMIIILRVLNITCLSTGKFIQSPGLVIQDHEEGEDLKQSTISCWTSTCEKTTDEELLHAFLQYFELLPTSNHKCVLSGLECPALQDDQRPCDESTALMLQPHWQMLDWKDIVSGAPEVNYM